MKNLRRKLEANPTDPKYIVTVYGVDLSVRVREHGPGEFRRMAGSFNRMAGELERTDRQRRNMTADVAHEMRTPLHVIQGNL